MEELSTVVHASKAITVGKQLCEKLVNLIPRHMFEIVIQAKHNTDILARQTIKPYRKDVTAKLVRIIYYIIFVLRSLLLFLLF